MSNYPEPRAPWGPTARARPSGWTADPKTSGPLTTRGAPPLRDRAPGPPPAAAIKYERMDGPADVSNAPDNDTLLFTFSGRPDTITLSAQAFGAVFTLTDRLRAERTIYHVPAGSSLETFMARDTVLVRNAVAASVAIVHCVGKWAALDEASSAY